MVVEVGCSSRANISGKVLYKGQPLTGGTVLFVSTQGKASETSQIGEDGSYHFANFPVGPVLIGVETKSAQPMTSRKGPPASMQPPKDVALPPGAKSGVYGSQANKHKVTVIPDKYAKPDDSGKTYTVVAGSQTHNIELP
jgi:hypothetical protein